jgi:hypothetical protein
MEAKRLIDGASFGPDALRAVGKAFDAAWAEIAGNFGNHPVQVETARPKLANAILSIADEGSRDVEVLKRARLSGWPWIIAYGQWRNESANCRKVKARLAEGARRPWRH